MNALKIIKLNAEHHGINTVAKWIFNEWGHLRPGNTLDKTIHQLQDGLRDNIVPSIYLAEMDSKHLGTVSLVECDMHIRQQYAPWVASVYVDTEWRNQGIGSKLMNHVESQAKNNDIKKVYLYTPKKKKMYSRLGWQGIEELEYLGNDVTIMIKNLT